METTAKTINENVMSCCQDMTVIAKIGARLIRFLNGQSLEFDCVLRDKRRGAELRRAIQNPVISPLSRGEMVPHLVLVL